MYPAGHTAIEDACSAKVGEQMREISPLGLSPNRQAVFSQRTLYAV
jgi:hypothetical protein